MKAPSLKPLILAVALTAAPSNLFSADSDTFSIAVPDFLVPLDNRTATLNVFGDGSQPQVTGYNVLGNQRVFLPANSRSAGSMTLSIHLPGFDAASQGEIVESLRLQISVRDMDFEPDQVYPGVFIQEFASLTSVNGIRLQQPFNFMDLVPAGAVTDGNLVALQPLTLPASMVPWVDFSQPQILTFSFAAEATSRGTRSYTINNIAEGIADRITYNYQIAPVPEPSTLALIALGASCLLWRSVRRRH